MNPRNLVLGLLILLVLSCNDDSNERKVGSISISVNPHDVAGRTGTDPSEIKAVLVSIESEGNSVYEMKKLTILHFGDDLISEQLQLPAGNYTITEFFVVDADDHVLFVTPIEGSPAAQLIEHPLPFAFTVNENESINVELEVLGVEDLEPAYFGYAAFKVNVMKLTALVMPELEKNISRVTYVLSDGFDGQRIEGEGDIVNRILNIDNPQLLGKTWRVKIYLWHEEMPDQPYPVLYRFKSDITFNGNLILLPPLQNPEWSEMFSSEQRHNDLIFKALLPLDPRGKYDMEIQLPPGTQLGYGSIGRGFFTPDGQDQMCEMGFEELYQSYIRGTSEASLPVPPAACLAQSDYVIDGHLSIDMSPHGGEPDTFIRFFEWEVINHVVRPTVY